ncbi:MAG: YceI family protein [Sporocytophaga sp.]|uniref:YceI family protein n=1 Tax=Sporocytophaga sp. TaxID=2231183 RepID=UPI001B0A66BE|nr:YceI family protein [Sporocytophaga sp.]MBO9702083.1 YceI family protein [Sporocytophaga sp.]
MRFHQIVLISSFIIAFSVKGFSQIYKSKEKSLNVSFFSETPLENIDAASNAGKGLINLATDSLVFKIPVNSFHFKNSLMQDHFNENYMETETYPDAWFKGKLNTPINNTTPGKTDVLVTGFLNIHGVKLYREIKGILNINEDGTILLSSDFMVKLKDHNIKVPSIVWEKIAEEVLVKVRGNFIPK